MRAKKGSNVRKYGSTRITKVIPETITYKKYMEENIVNVGIWMKENKKFKEGMYLRWAIFATLIVLA